MRNLLRISFHRLTDFFALLMFTRTDAVAIQIVRFGIAGAIATVADVSLLYLLASRHGLPYLLSAIFGFTLGISISYILSVIWVFSSRSISNRSIEAIAFVIIGVFGLGLTELIMYLSVESLHLHYMYGKAIAIVLVFGWNFGVRRAIMFKQSESAV